MSTDPEVSVFLGGNPASDKPIFHIAGTPGLSVDDLTSGVRSDTLFHSSLPYVMIERHRFALKDLGTASIYGFNSGTTPPAVTFNWYRVQLTDDLKNILNNKVVILFFKGSDGVYYHAFCSTLSVMGINTWGNSYDGHLRHSRILGTSDLGFMYHPEPDPQQSVFRTNTNYRTVYPPVSLDTHLGYESSMGYVDGDNFLSVFIDKNIQLEEVVFVSTNLNYVTSTPSYTSLVNEGDPVSISSDFFNIGNIDLTRYGFLKYTGGLASTNATDIVSCASHHILASHLSSTNYYVPTPSIDYFSVVSGEGLDDHGLEFDMFSGSIYGVKDNQTFPLFSGTDNANRFLYDRVISFSSDPIFRSWEIRSTDATVSGTTTLYSENVGIRDKLFGLLCYSDDSENFVAGSFDRSPDCSFSKSAGNAKNQ